MSSAYDSGEVELHAKILVRMDDQRVETTAGRIILREILPDQPIIRLGHIMVYSEQEATAALADLKEGADFVQIAQTSSVGGPRPAR